MFHTNRGFPVRTHESLAAMIPDYLVRPAKRAPGDARISIGKMLLTSQNTTLFLCRISKRVARQYTSVNERHGRRYTHYSVYYRTAATAYTVCEIRWSDAHVTELSHHETQPLAAAAMKALHATR